MLQAKSKRHDLKQEYDFFVTEVGDKSFQVRRLKLLSLEHEKVDEHDIA